MYINKKKNKKKDFWPSTPGRRPALHVTAGEKGRQNVNKKEYPSQRAFVVDILCPYDELYMDTCTVEFRCKCRVTHRSLSDGRMFRVHGVASLLFAA